MILKYQHVHNNLTRIEVYLANKTEKDMQAQVVPSLNMQAEDKSCVSIEHENIAFTQRNF